MMQQKKQFPSKTPDYYFCDDFGKRFYATEAQVYFAILELNRLITVCGGACLNDFYTLLGQESTVEGNMLVWEPSTMGLDWGMPWVDILIEDHYIGTTLTYKLHYTIWPSMEGRHPEY